MVVVIGIDPGKRGAVAAYDGQTMRVAVTPVLPGKKREYDVRGMARLLSALPVVRPAFVAIEKQTSMPKQGVVSMLKIGYGLGLWEGLVASLGVPYEIVKPRQWQSVAWSGLTKQKGQTKQNSILIASRLFPEVSLLATARCRTPHDGIADAICIALYAWRSLDRPERKEPRK